jgi:hypothetical protein
MKEGSEDDDYRNVEQHEEKYLDVSKHFVIDFNKQTYLDVDEKRGYLFKRYRKFINAGKLLSPTRNE